MIYYNLKNKENQKYIFSYILIIIMVPIIFLGIYIKYQNQELGNLNENYIYKINMKNVKIENKINLSEEKNNKDIYYKEKLTEKETKNIVENIFEKIGTKIDEIDLYEDTAIYWSNKREYNVWIDYKGGTYSYIDFSKYRNKEISQKIGASREEVENALKKLGIEIPENAEFNYDEKGNYSFTINMELQETNLINGNLICTYYEDGTIKELKNNIVKYNKTGYKEIISEKEAYDKILDGRFRYDENNLGKIKELEIENIKINYVLDTKGYYVPVYEFNIKINNNETVLQIKAIE